MKRVGALLVVVGSVAVIYGSIGYDRRKTVLDVAGIKATVTEHETTWIMPVAGAIAALSGVALLTSRRQAL